MPKFDFEFDRGFATSKDRKMIEKSYFQPINNSNILDFAKNVFIIEKLALPQAHLEA